MRPTDTTDTQRVTQGQARTDAACRLTGGAVGGAKGGAEHEQGGWSDWSSGRTGLAVRQFGAYVGDSSGRRLTQTSVTVLSDQRNGNIRKGSDMRPRNDSHTGSHSRRNMRQPVPYKGRGHCRDQCRGQGRPIGLSAGEETAAPRRRASTRSWRR